MLKFSLINFKFFRFVNSGLYFDYIFKKLSEIFVRNFFLYTALFFGEKFLIEVLTKKTIDNLLTINNSKIFKTKSDFSFFFYQLLIILFYFFFFFNILFLVF